MKHLALYHHSRVTPGKKHGTHRLGDKVHTMFCAYQYGVHHGEPVTMHLSSKLAYTDMMKQWNEILDLFPKDSVELKIWDDMGVLTDEEIIEFLKLKGIESPNVYFYEDAKEEDIDITYYLKNKQLVPPIDVEVDLPPQKFITMQWDSPDPSRRMPEDFIQRLVSYYQRTGYDLIEIGKDQSLAQISQYLSKAEMHVGVHSGMLHMAQMYMPHKKIHIYSQIGAQDHVKRFQGFGSKVNPLLGLV